jgi:hypothetical protein
MKKLKTILLLIGVALSALGAWMILGLISAAFVYLLLFAVFCLATYITIRLFISKSRESELDSAKSSHELATKDAATHMKQIEKTLDEYRRQLK